jgi:ribosomal protein S27AE
MLVIRVRRAGQRCPRCAGSMMLESDHNGIYLSCINCGNVIQETSPPEPLQQDGRMKRPPSTKRTKIRL